MTYISIFDNPNTISSNNQIYGESIFNYAAYNGITTVIEPLTDQISLLDGESIFNYATYNGIGTTVTPIDGYFRTIVSLQDTFNTLNTSFISLSNKFTTVNNFVYTSIPTITNQYNTITGGLSNLNIKLNSIQSLIQVANNPNYINSLLAITNTYNQISAAVTNLTDNVSSLISNTDYISGLPNSTPRVLTSKLNDTISIKDFGAIGDGITDDTLALQNAVSYCGNNSKSLYIPSGTYIINDNTGILNIAIMNDMSIFGDGLVSSLKFTGRYGLKIYSVNTDIKLSLKVENLWFECGYAGTDVGLSFINQYSHNLADMNLGLVMNNVTFKPSQYNWTRYYFINALYIKDCTHSRLTSVYIDGKASDIVHALYGIYIDNNCTDTKIIDCHIHFQKTAVYCGSTVKTPDYAEGIQLINTQLVYNDIGLNIDYTFIQPGHVISGCHINAFSNAIIIKNAISCFINNSLLYCQPTSTKNFTDISFYGVTGSVIENVITGGGNISKSNTDSFLLLDDALMYTPGTVYNPLTGNIDSNPIYNTAIVVNQVHLPAIGMCVNSPIGSNNYYTLTTGEPIAPLTGDNIVTPPISKIASNLNSINNCIVKVRNNGIILANSQNLGAQSNRIIEVQYQNKKTPFVQIIENTIQDNYIQGFDDFTSFVTLTLNSNKSIPSNVLTPLTWDNSSLGFFWKNSDPTKITIPYNYISNIVLTTSVEWDSNPTGYRKIIIVKNGVLSNGILTSGTIVAKSTVSAAGIFSDYYEETTHNCQTPVLSVNKNDYFQVYVLQSTTDALNINNVPYTYFKLE